MSRWFRHYAGMMRDDKLVRVAIRSGQTIERVVWIYGAILESAAEIDDGGLFDFDAAEAAYFLRAPEEDVGSVVDSLHAVGRLHEGHVVKWGDRQFKSDRSAERQARYRERQRGGDAGGEPPKPSGERDSNSQVTSLSRHGDAPDTETEPETEETPIIPLAGGRRGKCFIPADWKPPAVADLPPRSRACAEQWTDASYQTEAEGFLLYWRSERKMKSDWGDTWANRVIARHSAVMRDQKFGNAAPTSGKVELTAQELRERAEWFIRHGQQDRADECRKKAVLIEQRAA
jgi:hypothetical protein